MCVFEWDVGSFVAIFKLAAKVYAAYQDAPVGYRHISEDVMSLQTIVKMAVQHFESTTFENTFSNSDRELGQGVLKACQRVLEDLYSFPVEYNISAPASAHQIPEGVNTGVKDMRTLRASLISNTSSLNSFIQRSDILTIPFDISC